MANQSKTAWLIGMYTNDIEYRVKRLGYKLTHYYPDLNFNKRWGQPPPMIVFSEDLFSDPDGIVKLRTVYPKTIMISLPVYFPSEDPSHHKPMRMSSYGSILRLITSIQEREMRWEN
jgi:hypothetical protein